MESRSDIRFAGLLSNGTVAGELGSPILVVCEEGQWHNHEGDWVTWRAYSPHTQQPYLVRFYETEIEGLKGLLNEEESDESLNLNSENRAIPTSQVRCSSVDKLPTYLL